MVELEHRGVATLEELNRLFVAWVETVYHHTVHSETDETPIARFLAAGAPTLPTSDALHEAFLWSEQRRVTKVATVSLHGNHYEVDAALVYRKVDLVFDPFDLSRIEVRYEGRAMGNAVLHHTGRHSRHPMARMEQPPPAPATGIDYLGLVAARHAATTRRQIAYADLPAAPAPDQEQQS